MTDDLRMSVSLGGSSQEFPDRVVLRVNDRPYGLTGEQACALAAALTEAACQLDDFLAGKCATWQWRPTEQRNN